MNPQINYLEVAYQLYNHIKGCTNSKNHHISICAMKESIEKLSSLGLLSDDLDKDKLIKEIDIIIRSGRI